MTIDEYIARLRRQKNIIERSNIVEIAARDTVAKMGTRIFEKGRNSDDGQIGEYSTKPGVFTSQYYGNAVRGTEDNVFQPIPQPSKNNKKGYFGQYFSDGYKGFKAAIGRENKYVNLTLSGRLRSDFLTGFTKVNNLQTNLQLKNAFNEQKRGWMEDKYGDVFEATKAEQENFARVARFELDKLLP